MAERSAPDAPAPPVRDSGPNRRDRELGPLRLSLTGDRVLQQDAAPTSASRLERLTRSVSARIDAVMGRTTPAAKQGPIVVLVALALALGMSAAKAPLNDPVALAITIGLMVTASVLAIVITRRPSPVPLQSVIVLLDFMAIGTVRFSTGVSLSIISSLVVLPALWIAGLRGRRNIVYTCLGIAAVFLLPIVLQPLFRRSLTDASAALNDPNGVLRGLFAVVTGGIAASIINELAAQSRRRFEQVTAREQAIAREIDLGGEVQRALLPKGTSPIDGYEVAGVCIPARVVGGDFYDWYAIPGGLGFTLGDVMGKGVGAGMIAATTHAVVRSTNRDDDPIAALRITDRVLSTELIDVGSFTTMFHARLRAADGLLRYGDAGHGLTVLAHADGTWERLASSDMPLGLGVGGEWECHELVLGPGDMVVSFSDGVLDLYDGSLDAVGHVGRLAASATSAAEIVDALSTIARRTSNPDDVTIVAVRRAADA